MGFLPVQGEGVSGEEVVGNGVHPSKRFNGIGDDGYIVTVSPRGETGGGMGTGGVCRGYKVSSCGSELFVEWAVPPMGCFSPLMKHYRRSQALMASMALSSVVMRANQEHRVQLPTVRRRGF